MRPWLCGSCGWAAASYIQLLHCQLMSDVLCLTSYVVKELVQGLAGMGLFGTPQLRRLASASIVALADC